MATSEQRAQLLSKIREVYDPKMKKINLHYKRLDYIYSLITKCKEDHVGPRIASQAIDKYVREVCQETMGSNARKWFEIVKSLI